MKLISAIYENWGGIGKNKEMLFHLKKDLAHFKETAMNKTLIIGRIPMILLDILCLIVKI